MMNPRLLAAAALAVALLAVAVIALVFAGSSDDDSNDTAVASPTPTLASAGPTAPPAVPSPAPTLETAPAGTPVPRTSEQQARDFRLLEAPAGTLQFVTDGPYVIPENAFGIFYLDIETQRIEGWYDAAGQAGPLAASGDNRFSLFQRSRQTFQGGIAYPAGFYLADRATHKVYRWDGDAVPVYEERAFNPGEIATRGSLLLLRVPTADGDDWYSLYDVEAGEVVTAFQAEGEWGVIAQDAARIAIAGEDVFVVEVATGDVDLIAEGALGDVDLEGEIELIANPDGESFHVFTKPAKDRYEGVALRYSWEGEAVSKLTGNKVFPSPDGAYVAIAAPVELAEAGDELPSRWWVFTAHDTSDGSQLFRVVGVLPHYGFTAGNRWLADGSGLAVERPDYRLTLAMRDGSFRDLPGVPSPESPEVFGVSGGAVDAAGNPIVVLTFAGGVRDFADPWGDAGDEVRILVPHGGHDGPGTVATIIEPYVEAAPFAVGTPLQLNEAAVAFGLLNLYDEPAGTVIDRVEAPYRVTVHELAQRCTGRSTFDPQRCPIVDTAFNAGFMTLVTGGSADGNGGLTGLWARVTTPDGREGWLLVQVSTQGI